MRLKLNEKYTLSRFQYNLPWVWYTCPGSGTLPTFGTLPRFWVHYPGFTPAYIIGLFNSTFRYLDDLSNIDNPYFEGMVTQIYPNELQVNKANSAITPLFHNSLLPAIRFSFLSRDQIFTSR